MPTRSRLQPHLRRTYRGGDGPSSYTPRYDHLPPKMICDTRTCGGCRYLEQDVVQDEDRTVSLAEFLANCQHAKCKVVRLVRQQISKLQNMQYERFPAARNEASKRIRDKTPTEVHETLDGEVREVYGKVREPHNDPHGVEGEAEAFDGGSREAQEAAAAAAKRAAGATSVAGDAATASLRRAASPGRAVDRKWMLRILNRVRHRAHLILAAAAVGVIVWTALVYGVFLGATACGSGRTCFRSSLKYTHAKRTLF